MRVIPNSALSAAVPASEIELKLLMPPDALRRLDTHPLLKSGRHAVTKKLYSIYFDTPDLDLWRQDVALRVRKDGKRWVQTAKGGGKVQSGLHRRIELEAEVAGSLPDCTAIDGEAFSGLFSLPRLCAQLKPVFITEFSRTSRTVMPKPDVTIEVCIDRGEIKCGDSIEAICELELELKSGLPECLYEFALQLLDRVPLRIGNRSKAERGYALLRGEQSAPTRGRAAALIAAMPVSDAFKAIMRAMLSHLQANECGVLESRDPEYLHQARVALRRLRSVFSVFADVLQKEQTAPLTGELKWLAGELGPARDWDVFMTETLPPILGEFGDQDGLSALRRRCARFRQSARRRARNALGSQRYQRLALMLSVWLIAEPWLKQADDVTLTAFRTPVTEFAGAVLDRRFALVRKRGRKLQHLSAAELHRLRIAIKKLRYALDFFAMLFDAESVNRMRVPLVHLQDILGAINDATTVSALIGEIGVKSGKAVAEARNIVIGWGGDRAETLKRELRPAWKTFHDCGKFW